MHITVWQTIMKRPTYNSGTKIDKIIDPKVVTIDVTRYVLLS